MTNKGKIQIIVAVFLLIFLGMLFSNPTEKIVQAECNYDDWKALKEIDDRGFQVASEGYQAFTNGIESLIAGDVVGVEQATLELEQNIVDLTAVKEKREEALEKLGY